MNIMKKKLEEAWSELHRWIYMRDGSIVYQSFVQQSFEQNDGNFETMMLAVEDNIIEDDGEETIDWVSAKTSYEQMV